jgi:hypothetical protein
VVFSTSELVAIRKASLPRRDLKGSATQPCRIEAVFCRKRNAHRHDFDALASLTAGGWPLCGRKAR